MVHPVVLGSGKRMFKEGAAGTGLTLTDYRRGRVPTCSSTYAPAAAKPDQGDGETGRRQEAGVLDELQVHQIPALFGQGRLLFDVLPSRVELEIARVIDTPQATHIRYRVRR